MSRRLVVIGSLTGLGLAAHPAHAFMGSEMVPLLQLVSGQIEEIRHLTETVGVTKNQLEVLRAVNDGIGKVVTTVQTIEEIARRAKGLDPRTIRRISDLTNLVHEVKAIRSQTEGLLLVKAMLAKEAVQQAGLQSETAYTMGQEMIAVGSALQNESTTASPGRASQITASAASSQMMASGVELQTLAQIAQSQALMLELQRSEVERSAIGRQEQGQIFMRGLARKPTGGLGGGKR